MASPAAEFTILFEPEKYDPTDQEQRARKEEAFMRYKSIAGNNPFDSPATSEPTFRDTLKDRESGRPPPRQLRKQNKEAELTHKHVYILDHPALRDRDTLDDDTDMDELAFGRPKTPIEATTYPQRRNFDQSPKLKPRRSFNNMKPAERGHGMSKSVSDSNVLRPKQAFVTADGSPHRRMISPNSSAMHPRLSRGHDLDTIQEQEDYARNYKVIVRDMADSEQRMVRSPLKKLFGDGGLLGRSTNAKDLADPRFQKTGIKHWGEKMKARVEDMTRDISTHLPGPATRHSRTPSGPSKFPVSLSPYIQGDFYMQLELLLSIETNNFLMSEFKADRLSLASVRTIVAAWRNKGRPQVLGFRYDLSTQRELVGLNPETLHFSGINAFSKMKMLAVLAAWKVLAKEISVRTFCQPDSAVKKHLHDAEKVLEMIGASADGMLAFQEMRTRVAAEIYREERKEAERRGWDGRERAWSPSMAI